LDASVLKQLESYLQLSKKAIQIIRMSFALSITYNIVGLYLALSGILSPLFAAIIMPLSTITIISFVTITTTMYAKKILSVANLPKYDKYHSLPIRKTVILTHQT
jgi:Cu+-exporting ATPase